MPAQRISGDHTRPKENVIALNMHQWQSLLSQYSPRQAKKNIDDTSVENDVNMNK